MKYYIFFLAAVAYVLALLTLVISIAPSCKNEFATTDKRNLCFEAHMR